MTTLLTAEEMKRLLHEAKFPKGEKMTVDEVAEVVGPKFKEMNENPPEEVLRVREEMQGKKKAVRERLTWATNERTAAMSAWDKVFDRLDDAFPTWNANKVTDWNRAYRAFQGNTNDPGAATHYYSEYRAGRMTRDQAIAGLRKEGVRAPRLASKKLAASGLYGYTKATQRDVEAAIRKVQRHAMKIAKAAYARDPGVVGFLQTHAKRAKSRPAKILLAAMKEIGPKVASKGIKPGDRFQDQYGVWVVDKPQKGVSGAWMIYPEGRSKSNSKVEFEDNLNRFYTRVAAGNWWGWIEDKDGYMARFVGPSSQGRVMSMLRRLQNQNPDWGEFTAYNESHLVEGYYSPLKRRKSDPWFSRLPPRDKKKLDKLIDRVMENARKSASTKESAFGLYGMKSKTASLGLQACSELRAYAGQVAYDLHSRRASRYEQITGFLREHAKTARCGYSRMLLDSYPDAPEGLRMASVPRGVDAWLVWDE